LNDNGHSLGVEPHLGISTLVVARAVPFTHSPTN
jgi:hypothetical protein